MQVQVENLTLNTFNRLLANYVTHSMLLLVYLIVSTSEAQHCPLQKIYVDTYFVPDRLGLACQQI